MAAQIRVALIDDEKSARTSLVRLIKTAGIDVVAFSSAREFLQQPIREQFDCVVTDVRMPEIDGFSLQETLARELPHLSLIFISARGDIPMGIRAMKGGAVDFLEKPTDPDELLAAIRRGADRSRDQKALRAELADVQRRYLLLTPRERQVFELVTSGLLNKEASAELGTSEKTVKVHRARVMQKMQAESLAALVRMADRLKIRTAG